MMDEQLFQILSTTGAAGIVGLLMVWMFLRHADSKDTKTSDDDRFKVKLWVDLIRDMAGLKRKDGDE